MGNPNAWEFDPSGSNPGIGGVLDPAAEPYCDGDREELGGTIPRGMDTHFWVTYPGSNTTVPGCDTTYGAWEPQYDPTSAFNPDANPKSIYNTFHKWARLCDINNVGGANPDGDYVLHVQVPYPQHGELPVGTNDYSLRIAIMNGSGAAETLDAQTNQLSIYDGSNRMEATSVGLGINPQYYVGQITPDKAGQIIKVRWFDLGDNADLTLQILPPRDATVNGAPLTNWPICDAYMYDGTPSVQVGPNVSLTNCAYSMARQQYDGKILEMDINVPPGYSCGSDGKIDDCWFQAVQNYTNVGGNG
jgi:hypothetical protein